MSRRADLKRLRRELLTILESLDQDLEDENPELPRRERRGRAQSQLRALVDEAIRDVEADW